MNTSDVMPDYAVLAHPVPVRVSWWRRYVDPPWWPETLDCLPDHRTYPGYQSLARQDLFDLATDPTPEGRVGLLVAAYAWGTGKSAFLVGRRARTFTRTDLATVGGLLVGAFDLLHTSGPVAAYESMLPRQTNHVKFLGPAFYTKFLYFAAGYPSLGSPQPLILDKYVALGLNQHPDWTGPTLGTTGWSSSTYGKYLDFAAEQATAAGPGYSAAGVEMALFKSVPR